MQTHDEGEPWQDYVPPTQRPTPDAALAKMQYDYAALHRAASTLVRHWRNIGSPDDEQHYWSPRVTNELIGKIATLLQEHPYP